jgi:coenzyme F420-0:L-glutamate ligase / coenzyme F420-1:gamma-L-glutamate ligase
MNSDLHTFLRTRRSIRSFKMEPIPVATLQRILETATYAPSAHNLQPWRFAVLIGLAAKTNLAEAIAARFRQDMKADGISETEIQTRVERTIRRARHAPVIIVLCWDSLQVDHQPDEYRMHSEKIMGLQSVAAAGLQLLLAAHAEGLAGTWICWPLFARQETVSVLELPPEWEPQGMLFLGRSDDSPDAPVRSSMEEKVKWI